MKKYLLVLSLIIIAFQTGCETVEESRPSNAVARPMGNGNSIVLSNAKVGFAGYSVVLPDGYADVMTLKPDSPVSNMYIKWGKIIMDVNVAKFKNFLDVVERHAFYHHDRKTELVIHVLNWRVTGPSFAQLSGSQRKQVMSGLVSGPPPGAHGAWSEERMNGKTIYVFDGDMNTEFNRVGYGAIVVMGNLHEMFLLECISRDVDYAKAMQDLRQLAANVHIN